MILAYLLLTIMIIFWSLNFIVVHIAVEYIPPLSIALYRFIIASISFCIIDFYFKLSKKEKNIEINEIIDKKRISKKEWILIIIVSFIGQSLYFFTLYTAVDILGPSLPALFVCLLSPVLIAIFALLFFQEKLSKIKVLGFIIASIGAFLLISGGNLNNLTPKSPNFLGYLFALVTPLQWAIYSIITKKICKNTSMFNTLKYICYLATIELCIFVIIVGEFQIFIENLFNPIIILCAIYLGFVCHVIGYFIWQNSQKKIDSSKVASFLYIEPFITLIFSLLLQRKETIVIVNIVGGLIVLLAVLIINKEKKISCYKELSNN
ncbi:MAG: DMT family transporter [Promethearchaeota archaeon]